MKKICFAVLVIFLSCSSTQKNKTENGFSLQEVIDKSAEKISGEIPKNSRVAVISFESASYNLSNYIIGELNGSLKDQGINVVDRQNLAMAIKELNFQMSGYVDDNTARSIGKMLGADVVVTGQLLNLGVLYRYQASAIEVETAVRASIARFDVRNDKVMQSIIEATK